MRSLSRILPTLALVLMAGVTAAVGEPMVFGAWNFEGDTEEWITADEQAKLSVCKDPAHVYNGNGSLQLSYMQRTGAGEDDGPGTLFVLAEGHPDTGALHLAVQSSTAGLLLTMVREEDESTYVYLHYLPANDWQVIDVSLADFRLDDSSEDENGKLDPEQIVGLGVMDPTAWLLEAHEKEALPFFMLPAARRELWVDEVQWLSESPRKLRAAQGPGGAPASMIEDCDSAPVYFGILGGRNLKVSADREQAVDGSALRLEYELPAKTALSLLRPLRPELLADRSRIAFSARARNATALVLSLEEDTGATYSAVLELGAGTWQQFTVNLQDLKLDESSQDETPGLQMEKISSMQILDVGGLVAEKDVANTLWIDEVMAVK